MNALKTARVVLVEDSEEEASPLILALSQMGIGVWHFTGDVELLPAHPLDGVRVVFLDLRLGTTGPSAEVKHTFSHTLAVLDRIVGHSKSTAGIIYWAKYEEDIPVFESRLKEALPDFRPAFIRPIKSKRDLLAQTGVDAHDPSSLPAHVSASLESRSGFHLLLEWEQAVHNAASATTNLLTEVAGNHGEETHDEQLLRLLAALAAATGGRDVSDERAAVEGLFESLNPIHFDQLEQLSGKAVVAQGHAAVLKQAVNAGETLTADRKARINGIVLTARSAPGEADLQPGCVFVPRPDLGHKCPHFRCDMKLSEMGRDMLQFAADKEFKGLDVKLQKKLSQKDRAKLSEQAIARREAILGECGKILVEISPACDHAQAKRTTARFVGGLLVPEQHEKLINRKAHFMRSLAAIDVPGLDGAWLPVLNSRYVFGITRPESKLASVPVFRLRRPVLVDIQAWVAAQAARPGYIFV